MRIPILLVAAGAACLGATPAKKSVAQKIAPHQTTTHHTATKRAPVRAWRAGQTAPTPDRYKEIQTALAQKGYLHAEASGKWDQESADALSRFQKDQNLDATGKVNSLSIIALGLGPKYEAAAGKAPSPQPAP